MAAVSERMSRVDTAWLRMDNDVNLMMIVGVWLLKPAVTRAALAQRRVGDARAQQPDADDHHQVDVVVHPQPRGVHARHALRAEWRGGWHRVSP